MKGSIQGPKNDKNEIDTWKETNDPSKEGKQWAWVQLEKWFQGNQREQRLEAKGHTEVLTVIVTDYIPAGGSPESRKDEKWTVTFGINSFNKQIR